MIINVFLLIVGCLLDPGSAILVLTPLLAPIATAIGVDLVHFGVIMTVNLAIGMFTPPFGLNIFVAQALFKAPLKSIYPGLVPFIIINILALGIVTYVPEMSLYLLKFLGSGALFDAWLPPPVVVGGGRPSTSFFCGEGRQGRKEKTWVVGPSPTMTE